METEYINRKLYDAIFNFYTDPVSQEYYYKTVFSPTGNRLPDGKDELVKNVILREFASVFCRNMGLQEGAEAGVSEVEIAADRIYMNEVAYDRDHWYRMKYHIAVVDEDNYIRFATLAITDLWFGRLHEAMVNGDVTLIIGEPNPLQMTPEQRKNQMTYTIGVPEEGGLA